MGSDLTYDRVMRPENCFPPEVRALMAEKREAAFRELADYDRQTSYMGRCMDRLRSGSTRVKWYRAGLLKPKAKIARDYLMTDESGLSVVELVAYAMSCNRERWRLSHFGAEEYLASVQGLWRNCVPEAAALVETLGEGGLCVVKAVDS